MSENEASGGPVSTGWILLFVAICTGLSAPWMEDPALFTAARYSAAATMFAAFVLAVVVLAKNQTGPGIALLLSVIFAGPMSFYAAPDIHVAIVRAIQPPPTPPPVVKIIRVTPTPRDWKFERDQGNPLEIPAGAIERWSG